MEEEGGLLRHGPSQSQNISALSLPGFDPHQWGQVFAAAGLGVVPNSSNRIEFRKSLLKGSPGAVTGSPGSPGAGSSQVPRQAPRVA